MRHFEEQGGSLFLLFYVTFFKGLIVFLFLISAKDAATEAAIRAATEGKKDS